MRRQLAVILTALEGRDVDERTLFGTYGIIENPYTSFVTFFAPLVLKTDKGETFDFPARLFEAGQATTLSSGESSFQPNWLPWGRVREVC